MSTPNTTQDTYPTHYSAEDISQIERIKTWLDKPQANGKAYSQAALARVSRVSSSTLNQVIKGKYLTSPTSHIAAILSAMQLAEASVTESASPPVKTTVYKLAHSACGMARKYRNFAILSARVGTGKTFALKRYAKSKPNTFMIEATPLMTPQTVVRLLVKVVLGVASNTIKGGASEKFLAVVDALKNTDSLLIVDEAETLTEKSLEIVRRLRDLADIGVVYAGTEYLSALIKPESGQFNQTRSRTGFWPEVVMAITKDDAEALIQANLGAEDVSQEVMDRLYAYSKGSARMLCEGFMAALKEVRKGDEPLTVALVNKVAKEALSLQSMA